MRRVYLILIIILILAAGYGGYRLGRGRKIKTADLEQTIKVRDSLTVELKKSKANEELIKVAAAAEKKKYIQSDSIIKVLYVAKAAEADKFSAQIRSVKKYTGGELDSFIVNRYLRPTFNQSLRQVTISEWRLSAIAQDLVRLDSVSAVSKAQTGIIQQKDESIAFRDAVLARKDEVIAQQDSSFSIILQREVTFMQESVFWKDEASKYRSQRNWIIVGGVVVTVGVVALAIAVAK